MVVYKARDETLVKDGHIAVKLGGLCAGEEEAFILLLPAYTIEDLVNAAFPGKDT